MSALIAISDVKDARDQFVVSHGKCGAVGVFTAPAPLRLRRGQAVVIATQRGLEVGAVLCPASLLQARLLGATSAGALLRPLTHDDETKRVERAALEQVIFDTCRSWQARDDLALEILDVELLFDGAQAIVQYVGPEANTEAFVHALEQHFGLAIRLENLARPAESDDEHEHKCDKPDCGRSADGGGGCTSCSTGGGCSSCGSAKVDLREYFAHLRTKMETDRRTPLA